MNRKLLVVLAVCGLVVAGAALVETGGVLSGPTSPLPWLQLASGLIIFGTAVVVMWLRWRRRDTATWLDEFRGSQNR